MYRWMFILYLILDTKDQVTTKLRHRRFIDMTAKKGRNKLLLKLMPAKSISLESFIIYVLYKFCSV